MNGTGKKISDSLKRIEDDKNRLDLIKIKNLVEQEIPCSELLDSLEIFPFLYPLKNEISRWTGIPCTVIEYRIKNNDLSLNEKNLIITNLLLKVVNEYANICEDE
ncbi:MAG: hypothetical protein RR538_09430 [Erysipelotrichaceae bacterium]